MKLSEHVDVIRQLIYNAFNNNFSRMGLGEKKKMEVEKVLPELLPKREKFEDLIENHIGEVGSYEEAREKALDELTFTLFNRIAAIKVMEARNLFPPIITKQEESGNRSFGHKAWLENNPDMRSEELEGLKDYLRFEFDKLGVSIPLYNADYPYALLPGVISLNDIIDAFNSVEKDNDIEDEIWKSDDILGWLYESYNNYKKIAHKESKKKTEYHKVSVQSQVYTPRWVVEFLVHNSLGKMYLEMYPNSEIKDEYKIVNTPKKRVRDKKPLHKIQLIDPASGSGNFLLYAFDFFYALYEDQIDNYGADYDEEDIPKLIIENNLHGVDLDDRAIQLAQLGLWIKAKQKERSVSKLAFNVVSSDFFLPEYETVKHIFESEGYLEYEQRKLLEESWEELSNAYKFGSLIRVGEKINLKAKELEGQLEREVGQQTGLFANVDARKYADFKGGFFKNLEKAVGQFAKQNGNTFLTDKTKDAITFLKIVTNQYDIAAANPPYTDSADFGSELKKFVEENYKKPYKFHTNLYSTFILRCYEMTNTLGKVAMIHPRTFMFIKTFEDVRKFIVNKTFIDTFIDYSLGKIFGSIMVDPAFYVLEKTHLTDNKSWFVGLDPYTRTPEEKLKKEYTLNAIDDVINKKENKDSYFLSQEKIKQIKTWPFIFWISDSFREKFSLPAISSFADIKSGLATANNDRFLRYWWEVGKDYISIDHKIDQKKWVRYAKGGSYNKWYGNLWLVVNWGKNGEEMRETGRAVFRNKDYYFNKGITYSATSTKGTSFRVLPKNCVYDVKGASGFVSKGASFNSILATFNSKLSSYIIKCLNSTVETQVGDIKRIPYKEPNDNLKDLLEGLVENNISLKKRLLKYSIYDYEFDTNPLNLDGSIQKKLENYQFENLLIELIILLQESIIDDLILENYDLTDNDKLLVYKSRGIHLSSFSINKSEFDFLVKSIEKYNIEINSITLSRFILDSSTFDNNIDLSLLNQKKNNLELICSENKINPARLWYYISTNYNLNQEKKSELLTEWVSDYLMDLFKSSDDGIFSLNKNGHNNLFIAFINLLNTKKCNLSDLEVHLNQDIYTYFEKYFFNIFLNQLNLFPNLPKTPYIWHLSSGPEKGFECYVSIYQWNRDKLMRLRSVYIEYRQRTLINRQTDLADDNSANAQTEKDHIFNQLKEIDIFKKKIDELLEEGYNPKLDDGVAKNIAPLQNKNMLSHDVLNAGQLKKYLNADW